MALRVRQILESMDSVQRAGLKKLLPAKLKMPDVETARYPSALLGCFPDGETYSYLGIVAEHMLRLSLAEINVESLVRTAAAVCPSFGAVQEGKVRKSVTTAPFLECLVATRTALEGVLRTASALEFEPTITSGSVEGHPDMKNTTQVFEVKLTGMLKKNWPAFLAQVFAYGALDPAVTDLYLVLPLQKTVWHCAVGGWKKRGAYLEALTTWSSKAQTTGFETALMAMALCEEYRIGCHVGKQKVLATTLASLGDYSRPYQIFLGGPQSSKLSIGDDDLAASLGVVTKTRARVFVHSQYIINLCSVPAAEGDAWHTDLLVKNLQYTRAFGGQGVVVHVGKSVAAPVPEALERMRGALTVALEHATTDCPLLLETPAGQGTETLKGMAEFLDFVESFRDERLRVCLDTCHVFACGHSPMEYVEAGLARPGLLKLIHFNDSLGGCGSCVDRHAAIGAGQIGFEGMEALASVCAAAGLPMVIE